MFGGDSSTTPAPTPAVKAVPGVHSNAQATKDSEEMDTKPHSLLTSAEENTQIGGTISTEADYYIQKGLALYQNLISNPNILFLYLDSKLENDNRVFARIRAFYDPTGLSSGSPSASSYTNPYGFSSGNSDNLSVNLQELRISANLDHKLFFTIGRQKVKYGAAKFFNPTDFLNSQPFDFFLPSDERTGVDMVKMQIPSGTANLYAVGLTGNPTNGNPAGGYFRGELGYDGIANFLESGEISLSGYLPKGLPGRGGFDISQGVGDLDVYFEGAMGQAGGGDWKGAFSTGAGWQVRYSDRKTDTVSFEGEFAEYPTVGPGGIVSNSLTQFGVFAFVLAGPGGLTDITFMETNLYDFNSQSGFSRLDMACQFTNRISGRVYISAPWGQQGGTFSLPGLQAQTGARLDVNF